MTEKVLDLLWEKQLNKLNNQPFTSLSQMVIIFEIMPTKVLNTIAS